MSILSTFTFVKDFLTSIKTVKDLAKKEKPTLVNENSTVINNFHNSIENATEKTLNRFQSQLKELFNIHSVEDNLIAEFLKKCIDNNLIIPPSKYSDLEYIFDNLTDAHITKIAEIFGINKGWLFDKEHLYPYRNYYKNVHSFIDFVINKSFEENISGFAVRSDDFNFLEKERHQQLYIILRSPITDLYKNTIYRYYHIDTDWKWDYWRSRYQVKSIFRLFETPNNYLNIDGKTLTDNEIEIISDRNSCPDKIIRNKIMNTWYPYDYSTKPNENVNALELEEIEKIINYIEEQGYNNYLEKLLVTRYKKT